MDILMKRNQGIYTTQLAESCAEKEKSNSKYF
jgi:hypothetical protein